MGRTKHPSVPDSRIYDPMALNGMVVSPHHLASQAGLFMLQRGGTALDAAVAAAAVLSVAYPHMCGLGGDAFLLCFDAGSSSLLGLNASGAAGAAASAGFFAGRGMEAVPQRGPLAAVTVPGAVSGWGEAYRLSRERMGSPLAWSDLLEPAIACAERGVPVSPSLARWSRADSGPGGVLCAPWGAGRLYLHDGHPLAPGEVLRQPELAAVLRRIAEQGARELYEGETAHMLCRGLQEMGGLLTLKDFAAQHAFAAEPLRVRYRGLEACNLPPNTQGMASLEMLNILDRLDVRSMGDGTADYVHAMAEAAKLAFADRDEWLSDPADPDIPLDWLLSAAHADEMAARLRMDRALPAQRLSAGGDTVWLGAADRMGNAVSFIQSLYFDFGSGVVPAGTGILLQNRGCFFSLDPAHRNCLRPGRRTAHTLNPPMLLRNGRPYLVYGTMGGEGQPQTQAAVVTRIADFGCTPQQAVEAPRWLYGRSWGEASSSLTLEGRFAPEVFEELARRGHDVRKAAEYADIMGHAGAILLDPQTGVMQGGADPRGDGLAAGY